MLPENSQCVLHLEWMLDSHVTLRDSTHWSFVKYLLIKLCRNYTCWHNFSYNKIYCILTFLCNMIIVYYTTQPTDDVLLNRTFENYIILLTNIIPIGLIQISVLSLLLRSVVSDTQKTEGFSGSQEWFTRAVCIVDRATKCFLFSWVSLKTGHFIDYLINGLQEHTNIALKTRRNLPCRVRCSNYLPLSKAFHHVPNHYASRNFTKVEGSWIFMIFLSSFLVCTSQ